VLAAASDGLRGDARIAQKLIGKLAKALGADLASLGPLVETALVGLADDVAAQIDAADVVADALPDGEKKTTKALKALDRALGTLTALASADGPTVEHARAVFAAASALVKLQLKVRRAGGELARRNFLTVDVEGGAPYEASQVTARFVESSGTLEVRSASRSSTSPVAWCSGRSARTISPRSLVRRRARSRPAGSSCATSWSYRTRRETAAIGGPTTRPGHSVQTSVMCLSDFICWPQKQPSSVESRPKVSFA